jgi:uncharacterized damage-inducible protein DinB
MTADELRTHIRYSGWASRRLLEAALELDQEQLYRDMGASHKSLVDTLAHIHFADRIWFSRVVDPAVQTSAPADLLPHQSLEREWPAMQRRWEEWADSLTDADLPRVVHYKAMNGDPYETPVWQIVLHVVNHATLHRGQAMALLRQLGVAPPPTDLIFYYREKK